LKYIYKITDNKKYFASKEFSFVFDMDNGNTAFWGKTMEDDSDYNPHGPLLLDIEISEKCFGVGGSLCKECYKSNSPEGKNMSFDNFKIIADKLPEFVTQIAFGTSSCATTNPEFEKMLKYCREINIIPNLTVADITQETADMLSKYCGAVAVSNYLGKKDYCYDSIKKLSDTSLEQINMHLCVHDNTFDHAMSTMNDIKNDSRLEKLNAIVFLQLKNKGRGKNLKRLSDDQFNTLTQKALDSNRPFGYDSCGGNRFKNFCKENDKTELLQMVTGCESCKQSYYISADCKGYPCSFTEGEKGWIEGIDMLKINNFKDDVWYGKQTIKFRNMVENEFSTCPIFKV